MDCKRPWRSGAQPVRLALVRAAAALCASRSRRGVEHPPSAAVPVRRSFRPRLTRRCGREEKNCLAWFRAQAEEQLAGLSPDDPPPTPGSWTRITAVKEVKGEVRRSRCSSPRPQGVLNHCCCLWLQASLSTRKGNKKVAVYDLSLTLAWEGYHAEEETNVKGEWKLSEFVRQPRRLLAVASEQASERAAPPLCAPYGLTTHMRRQAQTMKTSTLSPSPLRERAGRTRRTAGTPKPFVGSSFGRCLASRRT